ncbi:hypothetical protein B0H14DRAFT_2694471 [Mycena olivaceomarginata]|nr:hypothetical protein B0H14DRAFT_2694471 [Mycena olivaceomarginata]
MGENGLDILYRSVLTDAMHNSAERSLDPSCHQGTREMVLSDLRAWSQDDRREGSLLWLYGSAGMGKSAVAQTFAANCEKERILGASFFFKRQDTGRGTWKGLFSTLAYQLAVSFQELRGEIQEAVENDRLVIGQTIYSPRHSKQVPSLAVRPIIVIDGLDECEDRGVQVMLLKLLIDGLGNGGLPARVLIASRPEPHLREVLQAGENFDFCRHLELRPDKSAYADVRRYLCDEFLRIRHLHTSRGIPLETNWPGQDSINHLVEKSSGNFHLCRNSERLDDVLRLDPQSTTPLDNLYTQILSTVPKKTILRRVLHAMVRISEDLNPEEIDAALQLRTGTSRLVLRGLHSVVCVPPVRTVGFRYGITFLHASLCDFLLDPIRSSELCVAAPHLDSQLVRSMIVFLSSSSPNSLLFNELAQDLVCYVVRIEPTADLLPVLQNPNILQASLPLALESISEIIDWLQACCPLPSNIIRIWDDFRFIRELENPVQTKGFLSDNSYDECFIQILAQNPQTLSILRIASVWPYDDPWDTALDLLRVTWDALRPLTALRRYISNARTLSKFLLEFIRDSCRARTLYAAPQDIYEFAALLCISRIRQILLNNQFFQLNRTWLLMIAWCKHSHIVLHELESLDVAQLCAGPLRSDPEYHLACHKDFLSPGSVKWIVNWLWSFPSPPKQAIEFWERQMVAVETCRQSLLQQRPPQDDDTALGFTATHTLL